MQPSPREKEGQTYEPAGHQGKFGREKGLEILNPGNKYYSICLVYPIWYEFHIESEYR